MEQQGSFDKLLAESRDLVCERLGGALSAMLDKADEALSALTVQTQSREAQQPVQETRQKILADRHKLEREFRRFYLRDFQRRSDSVKAGGQSFSELELSSLQLVGEQMLEETLKFREMAAKLRRYCEEELAALDQRVGVLLGDANLLDEANPFSPLAISDAYQQACHEFDSDVNVRKVLLRLFDDHVLDDIRSIYKAVNALLVQNGILPKIRYGVSRKEDGKPAAASAPAEEKAPEQGFFALLQKLVGGTGGAAPAAAPAPGQSVLQGPELLGSLTRIQRGDAGGVAGGLPTPADSANTNILRELKTSLGAGMVQMDVMTLDIVAMLFDQLFDDPKIPIGMKGLVGRLQIPMLKVAIADKSFFSRKSHPARQLLDTLGVIALRLPADFNASHAQFARLEGIIQEILDSFQEDMSIFDTVRERLQTVVAEEDQRVEREVSVVAQRIEQTENLAVAKTAAQEELQIRLQAGSMPGPVLEFLVEHWLKLLLLLHAKDGKESEEWKNALEAMDQLIWSVEPKNTVQERRELAAAVPGLLKRLSAGLQSAGAEDGVREQFFAQLMTYHTQNLAMGAKGKEAAPQAPHGARPAAVDFTAPVTVKNPYGGGEVQVTALSGRAADVPADVTMGAWMEIREDKQAEPRVAKVLFVSPKKTRYVLSDRRGQNFLEFTRAELARRMRAGEVARLPKEPEEPLFDRIMNSLLGKLRAPAAA